jgi:hypothetical protein
MSGHGHVTPNDDGSMARCGGPAICEVCAKEYFAKHGRAYLDGTTPAGPPGQAGIDYVSGRETEAADSMAEEPDNGPGDVGAPSDFDRRAAALHMALRQRQILGGTILVTHGLASVEMLIEDADKIHAFLKGETPK